MKIVNKLIGGDKVQSVGAGCCNIEPSYHSVKCYFCCFIRKKCVQTT